MAVAAVVLSPLAALEADAAVNSGPATANGPGIAIENSGGNVEMGEGHSESKVTHGDPKAAPAAPAAPGLGTSSTPAAKPAVNPAADKVAKAKALVDAARARAQAQVDAARQHAQQAVEQAHQQADEARSRGDAQSEEAKTRSSTYSADD
ncbi:MAG TPA: hypothetical protein VMZ22_10535 [Acidimicrobiales bacterium]|nr:hypothetical protein [Acidimicrobiales bacterium]